VAALTGLGWGRTTGAALRGATKTTDNAATQRYFLERRLEDVKYLRRIVIDSLPFRVGRRPGSDLMLPFESVSKLHAELYLDGDALRVRDVGSTNGTFVNRVRIEDAPLRVGDVLHFAEFEFRLGAQSVDAGEPEEAEHSETLSLRVPKLSQRFPTDTADLQEMLRTQAVAPVYHPILTLPGGAVAGLEVLGRGRLPALPEAPAELFRVAAGMGVEAELSRLFRRVGVEAVAQRKGLPPLFLNTHPSELGHPALIESLAELLKLAPGLKLFLEVHEGALSDAPQVAELRADLHHLGIGLAYDDFGAGEARLIELAEVPPDFLKFDHRFVRGIDQAPSSRRRMLGSLVAAAKDLEVQTIAEGIETAEEAEVCARVGFSHAQGFFFGAPLDPESI
jgi:EAL domain-containing protein (putative c-di-GMP-specific phosphodiesterase class I)